MLKNPSLICCYFLYAWVWSLWLWGWIGLQISTRFHHGQECDMTFSGPNYVPIRISSPTKTTKNSKYGGNQSDKKKNILDKNRPYQLYQYQDYRDIRYQQQEQQHSDAFCNNASTLVLYIPGHGGSHTQCRSLGSHGLNLTHQSYTWHQLRQLQHYILRQSSLEQQLDEEKEHRQVKATIYDVYCIDFREQSSALHGNFLHQQVQFVVKVLDYFQTMSSKCENYYSERQKSSRQRRLVLVGHSIGGLVARAAAAETITNGYHYFSKEKNNLFLLTLATPHGGLPYNWDTSVSNFYPLLQLSSSSEQERLPFISICGGIRDELIPPFLCAPPPLKKGHDAENKNNLILDHDGGTSRAFLTNQIIMKRKQSAGNKENSNDPSTVSLGVDHKAIVWCHNVLSAIRPWILGGQLGGGKGVSRENRNNNRIFLHAVESQWTAYQHDLQKQGGSVTALLHMVALQSTMYYHVEILFAFFAIQCYCLHLWSNRFGCRHLGQACHLAHISSVATSLLILGPWTQRQELHGTSHLIWMGMMLILALVSHSILVVISIALKTWSSRLLFFRHGYWRSDNGMPKEKTEQDHPSIVLARRTARTSMSDKYHYFLSALRMWAISTVVVMGCITLYWCMTGILSQLQSIMWNSVELYIGLVAQLVWSTAFVSLLLLTYLVSLWACCFLSSKNGSSYNHVIWGTWILISWPCLVFGKIINSFWTLRHHFDLVEQPGWVWKSDVTFCLYACLPIALKWIFLLTNLSDCGREGPSSNNKTWMTFKQWAVVLECIVMGMLALSLRDVGSAYKVGYLLGWVSLFDCIHR